jgi:predicted nucleic acid-binding protein
MASLDADQASSSRRSWQRDFERVVGRSDSSAKAIHADNLVAFSLVYDFHTTSRQACIRPSRISKVEHRRIPIQNQRVAGQGLATSRIAVAEVSGGDMSGFAGDTRIDPLPICELDTPVAQIDASQTASMRAALQRRGIRVSLDAADTFGSIIGLLRIRAGEGIVTPTKTTLEL